MYWKQPITTGITQFDTVTEIILSYIFLRLRKTDMLAPKEFWHGNQRHLYQLEKNQCIFAVDRFCRESGIPKNRVKKSLKLIENLQIDENLTITLTITRKTFGLIVTVKNGDELFSLDNHFDNHSPITSTSLANHLPITVSTSNKNDKNVETVNTEKSEEAQDQNFDHFTSELKQTHPTLLEHPSLQKIYRAACRHGGEDFAGFVSFVFRNKTFEQVSKYQWYSNYAEDYATKKLEEKAKQKKQDEIGEQRLTAEYEAFLLAD